MKNKQKTNLFRFVTLRSPQTITKEKEELGFVYPLTFDEYDNVSHFLDGGNWTPSDSDEENRTSVFALAVDSYPRKSVGVLKSTYNFLWEFATWLAQNKETISREVIDTYTLPSELSITEAVDVWDNLFYEVIKRRNPNVRETCLSLLVANNFIQKFSNYSVTAVPNETEEEMESRLLKEHKDLKRLANGKVVLHSFFALPKEKTNSFSGYTDYNSNPHILALHNARAASLELTELEELHLEFTNLLDIFNTEKNAAFKDYEDNYLADINDLKNTFKKDNPDLFNQDEMMESKSITTINSASNEDQDDTDRIKSSASESTIEELLHLVPNQRTIDDLIPTGFLPSFAFDFHESLSQEFLEDHERTPHLDAFIAVNNLSGAQIEDALILIEKRISKLKRVARKVVKGKPKEILVNGIATEVLPSQDLDCVLGFKTILQDDITNKSSVLLTIASGIEYALLDNIDLTIEVDSTSKIANSYDLVSNNGEALTVELFADDLFDAVGAGLSLSVQGSFTLSNGRQYSLDITSNTSNKFTFTRAIRVYDNSEGQDLFYGVNKIGVADFRRVEQELYTYIPGEVSHIENVMAREYKERTTRNLIKTSESFENTSETEQESELETNGSNSESFSSEVAQVINQEKSRNFGISASVNGKPTESFQYSIGGTANFSNSQSKSNTNSIAIESAKEITERALERMKQKVSFKRTSKIIQEVENRTNQGFDNREGENHVTGVYRWIDKVFKNRIVNYGKRLIYEFMVPEPSRFYKEAIVIKAEKEGTNNFENKGNLETGGDLIKPDHPNEIKIEDKNGFYSFEDINRDNYSSLCSAYGVSAPDPKQEFVTVGPSFTARFDKPNDFNSVSNAEYRTPEYYEAISARVNCVFTGNGTGGHIYFDVLGKSVDRGTTKKGDSSDMDNNPTVNNPVEGVIPITVSGQKIQGVAVSGTVKCRWKLEEYDKWRNLVFTAVMDAYENQLAIYQEALAKHEAELSQEAAIAEEENKETKLTHNSKFNDKIIKTELKRLCIEMLVAPFNYKQGKDFYLKGASNVPQLKLSPELDHYSNQVKFFEQAFDWDLMAENFMPYYWADRSNWKALFQSQNGVDHKFQAFLQSGMGNVMVPVKRGFEDAVSYYMETGDIWTGSGLVIDTDDKLYLSIVDEVTNIEGVVEGAEWETIVPTSLNILQNKSAIIDEGNLPLVMNDPDSLLIESTTALGDSSEG